MYDTFVVVPLMWTLEYFVCVYNYTVILVPGDPLRSYHRHFK